MASSSANNRLNRPLGAALDEAEATISPSWAQLLHAWRTGHQGRELCDHINRRLAGGAIVYPATPLRALELTPLEEVRVVILGQDPYHGPGQAQGLAYSVTLGMKPPPSLRNIYMEIERDLGPLRSPAGGDLSHWARQGVLLLNASLTVEEARPGSHAGRGWEALTSGLVSAVARHPRPKAFMLWGRHAQAHRESIEAAGGPHLVLCANHPSPLSARRPPQPFLGCGHFGRALEFLNRQDPLAAPIAW